MQENHGSMHRIYICMVQVITFDHTIIYIIYFFSSAEPSIIFFLIFIETVNIEQISITEYRHIIWECVFALYLYINYCKFKIRRRNFLCFLLCMYKLNF